MEISSLSHLLEVLKEHKLTYFHPHKGRSRDYKGGNLSPPSRSDWCKSLSDWGPHAETLSARWRPISSPNVPIQGLKVLAMKEAIPIKPDSSEPFWCVILSRRFKLKLYIAGGLRLTARPGPQTCFVGPHLGEWKLLLSTELEISGLGRRLC